MIEQQKKAEGEALISTVLFDNVSEVLHDRVNAVSYTHLDVYKRQHDADTEAKKKDLFAKVRTGQVRVLLGSTQKMGAGTNVQDLSLIHI